MSNEKTIDANKYANDSKLLAAHKRLVISGSTECGGFAVDVEFLRKANNTPWRRERLAEKVPAGAVLHVIDALREYMIEEYRSIEKDERIPSPTPIDYKAKKDAPSARAKRKAVPSAPSVTTVKASKGGRSAKTGGAVVIRV